MSGSTGRKRPEAIAELSYSPSANTWGPTAMVDTSLAGKGGGTVIIYRANRTCRNCGEPVGCLGVDWYATTDWAAPVVVAVDCETGKGTYRCPSCGERGRWWEAAGSKEEQ